MNKLPYFVAALAAAGLMIAVIAYPTNPEPAGASQDQTDTVAVTPAASFAVADEAGEMTMSVPNMHCQYMCFPKVKETLEQMASVEKVELAPQKNPGALDNHAVVIQYAEGFDPGDAVARLAAADYPDSAPVSDDS